MKPDARHALLTALARVVRQHLTDPETCGREAVQLLRVAGASWTDLLGPAPVRGSAEAMALIGNGRNRHPRQLGRAVMAMAAYATPFELVCVALKAHTAPPTTDIAGDLFGLLDHLLDRAAAEAKAAGSLASLGVTS